MNAIRRFPSQLSRISPFSMTGDVLSLLASCFRHFCHVIEDGRHPRMPLLAQSSRVLTLPLR